MVLLQYLLPETIVTSLTKWRTHDTGSQKHVAQVPRTHAEARYNSYDTRICLNKRSSTVQQG